MKILYLADINSPIAQNWIRYFARPGNEIEIITGHRPLDRTLDDVRIHHVPLLASYLDQYTTTQMSQARTRGTGVSKSREQVSNLVRPLNRMLGLQYVWQSYIGPLDVQRNRARVRAIADTFRPDLVHGLRIPTEGYAATQITNAPVVLSIWGNDLTLYAGRSVLSRRFTRTALQYSRGLHADCHRDIRLAFDYGYPNNRPTLVIPTSGGIRQSTVSPARLLEWQERLSIPTGAPVVINPRGTRAYVCIREFFESIPSILRAVPDAIFICPATQNHPQVTQLVEKLGIRKSVRLLPVVSQEDLTALFRLADVMVSPTLHDGIPNSLLEAMAQDAFPVASNLASIREWITHGENGLLFDPTSPSELAKATTHALRDHDLRERAGTINRRRIRESADYDTCMRQADAFYHRVLESESHLIS